MPTFVRLVDYNNDKETHFHERLNRYQIDQRTFEKIPGNPVAYWASGSTYAVYKDQGLLSDFASAKSGQNTGDNARFTRMWYEVGFSRIGISYSDLSPTKNGQHKWFPYNKGGDPRKWYGNINFVVNWEEDGKEIKEYAVIRNNGKHWSRYIQNLEYMFKPVLTWTFINSSFPSFRYLPAGFLSDYSGCFIYAKREKLLYFCSLLNTKLTNHFIELTNPTMNLQPGNINNIPVIESDISKADPKICLSIAKCDWDMHESSWDFQGSPLLLDYSSPKLERVIDEELTEWLWKPKKAIENGLDLQIQVDSFKNHWSALFVDMHKIEEELNKYFISLYDLQHELSSEVSYTEITILQEEYLELPRKEFRIEFDDVAIVKQYISYGIGCLVGRYSVEKNGLILADAGATIDDFKAKIQSALFLPDEDGILPVTDEDDFPDDLTTAFKSWLRFLSGKHYDDNLRWIEERLGKDLRTYFDRDFYKEHVKRYKSRPIYWMVSSPSGAFRALIYLHRYTKDTVGKILNDYVRPYRTKLDQKIRGLESVIDSSSSSAGEKTKAKKRLAQLEKYKVEIETWEKEKLYPLALKRVELDLDDGVKVNYRKLEGILEPVKQLEAKDEED